MKNLGLPTGNAPVLLSSQDKVLNFHTLETIRNHSIENDKAEIWHS